MPNRLIQVNLSCQEVLILISLYGGKWIRLGTLCCNRDILAIPISIVTFELALSIGGSFFSQHNCRLLTSTL